MEDTSTFVDVLVYWNPNILKSTIMRADGKKQRNCGLHHSAPSRSADGVAGSQNPTLNSVKFCHLIPCKLFLEMTQFEKIIFPTEFPLIKKKNQTYVDNFNKLSYMSLLLN